MVRGASWQAASQPPRSRKRFRDSGRPPKPLSVGAIAIADRRANAVGPVRLTCQPNGLRVDLLRVASFSAGFAFGSLADAVSFRVPYTAVRALVREGNTLHLALDHRAAEPFNRFALARFSHDPLSSLMRWFRVRHAASLASYLLPVPLAALAVWLLPSQHAGGFLGVAAVALVVGWLSYRLMRRLVAWLTWGGPPSYQLRARFEEALADRLGLKPAAELAGGPLPARRPAEEVAPTPAGALAASFRPRAFAAVGLAAAGLALAAVVAVQRYGVADVVLLPVDVARGGIMAPAAAVSDAAVELGTPDHAFCTCERVDSPLWHDGVPQLSVLVTPIRGQIDEHELKLGETYQVGSGASAAAPAGRRRGRVELDLSVVNNSTEELDTVSLVATFARRDEQGRRRNITERGLFWPAKLGPAGTVKWRIEAPGTEMKVESRLDGRLGQQGLEAASADDFYQLRNARLQAVRLHSAMMLSYLRDPRAEKLMTSLGRLTAPQQRVRDQVLTTHTPLAACNARVVEDQLEVCVFNGTSELHRALVVRELAEGGKTHALRDLFIAGRGLKFVLAVDESRRAAGLRVEPLR